MENLEKPNVIKANEDVIKSIGFIITPEGKTAIAQILSTKPFNSVLAIANLLEKSEFSEEEANQIINFIGMYPYGEVVGFFGKLKEYFAESV